MKRGRLPLTALRSFEAAGRHLSFSRAAEELFVSQAAISRQIRELEGSDRQAAVRASASPRRSDRAWPNPARSIDRQFRRHRPAAVANHRRTGTELASGQRRAGVRRCLADTATQSVSSSGIPKSTFRSMSTTRLVEFRSHEAEIAIRYAAVANSWPRTEARHLIDVSLTPVLTPALLASGPPLSSPADLRHYTLLHDENRDGWAQWFQAVGLPDLALQRGPIYADAALVMQAAKLGHGVALGDRVMEGDDLRFGNLRPAVRDGSALRRLLAGRAQLQSPQPAGKGICRLGEKRNSRRPCVSR